MTCPSEGWTEPHSKRNALVDSRDRHLVHAQMRLPGLHPCQLSSHLPLLQLHETVLGRPAPLCWSLCSLDSQPFGPAPLACTNHVALLIKCMKIHHDTEPRPLSLLLWSFDIH